MDKRLIAKFVAKMLVSTAVGGVVTKALSATIPATKNFKIADMSGGVVGWMVSENLELQINEKIDKFFDRREAAQK